MISVLTAVAPRQVPLLSSAYASLLEQDVAWEWVVQVDGPSVELPVEGQRITAASNGRNLGVSATRNRALLRASGTHVLALDADDELLPGALARLMAAMESEPGAAYALGETIDRFPDGRRLVRFARRPYNAGGLAPRALEEEWRTSKNLFLQPGAALYRRESVLAVGGWPAITGMEDQDLLLSVSTLQPGVYVPDPVYLYRQHHQQTTRTDDFEHEREDHRRWCDTRLRALRAVHGEDAGDLARLETPIPNAEEIETFTTAEWRAAASSLDGEG